MIPFHAFPEDRSDVIWEAEEATQKRKERERLKHELGKLPDDPFGIKLFMDTHNFKDSGLYSGSGVAVRLMVERHELEAFVKEMESEFGKEQCND